MNLDIDKFYKCTRLKMYALLYSVNALPGASDLYTRDGRKKPVYSEEQ